VTLIGDRPNTELPSLSTTTMRRHSAGISCRASTARSRRSSNRGSELGWSCAAAFSAAVRSASGGIWPLME
jgi:hypothetical protein